jgi:F-type H+-transporting ATPase subunit b
MPQLDVSTFSSQVFWFFISFYLLFLVVRHIFLPELERRIYIRNKKVLDSFNNSVYLLKLAESQVRRYSKALDLAEVHIKKIVSDTLTQIEKMKESVASKLEEESKKMAQFVQEEIENFKVQHVDKLKEITADITLIYYAKLTGSEMSKEKFLLAKKF